MKEIRAIHKAGELPRFEREFFDGRERFTCIGDGAVGGKAAGLAFARQLLARDFPEDRFDNVEVTIPHLTVVATDTFDQFLSINKLAEVACSDEPDHIKALAFLKGELPVDIVGDLRALINQVKQPLAIRSSSLLEDAIFEPFAGVYATKMIPNNQAEPDTRFRKLVEAIKLIYASTFFKEARDYRQITSRGNEEEKMAVVIQEVLGRRHGERFYPTVSGVARSFNFYPMGSARPADGVVQLALGLGKTIVDGGKCWTYSPAFPRVSPPFTIKELFEQTQTEFWAVNMGRPPAFDPVRETEYLAHASLKDAEYDGVLNQIASTYVADNDRVVMGTGPNGPRILNFAPLIRLSDYPINDLLIQVEKLFKAEMGGDIEFEFAVTLDARRDRRAARFGFLQVRPMVVSHDIVDVTDDELHGDNVLISSDRVMGNGRKDNLRDIVYIKPDTFEARHTHRIAEELDTLNRTLNEERTPYILVGFGRWGSSDPWLGIPVKWSSISGARVLVEATLPQMNVELSQGSHFFHNISSFQVFHFSVRHDGPFSIDWHWLARQKQVRETDFLRHVRLGESLSVKVDGRTSRGVITK